MNNKLQLLLFLVTITLLGACSQRTDIEPLSFNNSLTPTGQKHILIFGATKGTGLETAKKLIARGDHVTAFVRASSNLDALNALKVDYVTGDALNQSEVNKAFENKQFDAVLTTLGCFKCDTPPDYLGNRHIFESAKRSNNLRVVMISTIGVGKSDAGIPWISKQMLKDIIALKSQAEETLISSGLDYTIIRPGALKNAAATHKGLLTEDPTVIGVITREDLATLIIQSIDSSNTVNKIYSAIDAEMVWPWGMF